MTTEQTDGMKELRAAYERAEAERDAALGELQAFRTTVTFKEAGYTPKHAELYLKTNPDGEINPDTVKAFAEEYGLSPVQTPVATPDAGSHLPADGSPPPLERTLADGPPKDANLSSFAGVGGSPQGQLESAAPMKMNREEFQKLLRDNPEHAAQAYREGRVERNEANVQADDLVRKGVISR